MRRFVGLKLTAAIPDETTILNFRHLLEQHDLGQKLFESINEHLAAQELMLREGTIIDASIAGEVTVIEQRYRIRDKNDDYRWMLTRGEVVKNGDGKAIRVVGRQTDVDQESEPFVDLLEDAMRDLLLLGG